MRRCRHGGPCVETLTKKEVEELTNRHVWRVARGEVSAKIGAEDMLLESIAKVFAKSIAAEYKIYLMAVPEYRKYHRRLPGSEKTKRLRLKRYKRVLDWFCKNHDFGYTQ